MWAQLYLVKSHHSKYKEQLSSMIWILELVELKLWIRRIEMWSKWTYSIEFIDPAKTQIANCEFKCELIELRIR